MGDFDDDFNDDSGKPANNDERPAPYKPEELNLEEEAKLANEGIGENFHRYKDQTVTCIPIGLVEPVEKFEDILESELLLKNVKSLKYSETTPIQKWAMPAIMKGLDIIGCAQTGSGKTAAFLLPILQTLLKLDIQPHDPNSECQHPYALLISPTRELARQLYTHAEMLAKDSIIKCRVIYGQVATQHLRSKLLTGCHMLVATPGRLKDFLERGWIGFSNIKYIILDEGDRLVDDGFTTQIREFFNHPTMPPSEQRQTLFFSATFKEEIQKSAREYLKDDFVFLTVGRIGAANEDIKQEFLHVKRSDKKRELKKILATVPPEDKCIVFTQTKNMADVLASFFTSLNLSSTSIHGDRHQSQREQAINAFKKGQKRFLISSPVGNRGLDLPKVAIVINYDLPPNIDEYVHRIGRTGRAGHRGRAISFYDSDKDGELLPELLMILKEAKQEIPNWLENGGVDSTSNDDGWANSTTDVATDDGWGNSASNAAADDGWANSTTHVSAEDGSGGSTANAAADDGWGSSTTNATTDDGWGGSTTNAATDDGWGLSTTHVAKKDGWGTSYRHVSKKDSWGNSSRHASKKDDWGTSNSHDSKKHNWGNSTTRANDDGWGSSTTNSAADDGWGTSTTNVVVDDNWGSSSGPIAKKDSWGNSSRHASKNDDWGSSTANTAANDDWGTSTSHVAKKDDWGNSTTNAATDEGWGTSITHVANNDDPSSLTKKTAGTTSKKTKSNDWDTREQFKRPRI